MSSLPGAGCTIWWAPLTLAEVGLRSLLGPSERARVDACTAPADAARRLLTAALLRCALAEIIGEAPTALRIDRTCDDCGEQHGRPRVLDHELYASASHAGVLTAVVVDESPVGIDIERVGRLPAAELDAWMHREAALKAGTPKLHFAPLTPALDGYRGVLATTGTGAPRQRDATRLLERYR